MDPNFKKRNQHYVPQFWQRRFADGTGRLHVRYTQSADKLQNVKNRGKARPVNPEKTMTGDYTYTVFDENFRPYDVLEDLLAKAENEIKQTEDEILNPATMVTADLRRRFCRGIAIAACRLPHVMKRSRRLRIALAYALAEVGRMDRAAFDAKVARFGQILTDAEYGALKATPEGELMRQAIYLSELSPQDPNFSEQDALEAVPMMTEIFNRMDIEILESNGSPFFIVGDTPIPDSDLVMGFTVPLSKTAAGRFKPATGTPTFSRTAATAAEIAAINEEQYHNSATHVIGPDAAYLDSLV